LKSHEIILLTHLCQLKSNPHSEICTKFKSIQMKLVVFGATGFSGKVILAEALSKGHEVTVLVRDASRITLHHENLRVLEGNVLEPNAVSNALLHQQVVIQCLGIGGKGDGKPNFLVSDATQIIVDEMQKSNVKRLVAMSNVGAGNSIAFLPRFFARIILPYFMKWLKVIIDDKNRMEAIIMNSPLDWTIVRCPNITDKPARNFCHATLDGRDLKLSITLGDMATFIVNQITDLSFSRQAPSISN
jgi:putative NADH-flavin reductase